MMDAEISRAEALQGIYLSAPGRAWRYYRLVLVSTFSGDAAQEVLADYRPRYAAAFHEVGHALARFLTIGFSFDIALCSFGGLAGRFDSQDQAEAIGIKRTDSQIREPFEAALDLAGVADRAARVRAALVRRFSGLWYRAAISELGHRLVERGYIAGPELDEYFEVMFRRSPARVRAMAQANERIT